MLRPVMLFAGLLAGPCLLAQSLHGGVAAGGMMYHGDLGHSPLHEMRVATAASGHFDINPRLSVFGQYMFGHIGGADRNSVDLIPRNLSFDSHVFEWSLGLRVNLLRDDRYVLVPYLFASAAFYRVAPWTHDSLGNQVYLYPVHTQGNGLGAFPELPADRLIKFCVPMGAGISFILTRRLSLDAEGSLRHTFDDRMDDVGGLYPDPARLTASGNARIDLTHRAGELKQGDFPYPPAGTRRGNPDTNDWYSSLQLRLRVKLFTRESPHSRRRTLLGDDMWMY